MSSAGRRRPYRLGIIADAAESAFCAFTSAAALIGIGLNAWLGWWWADPRRCSRHHGLGSQGGHRSLGTRRRLTDGENRKPITMWSLGANVAATQADDFPRQANGYGQAGDDHASSRTDPDDAERLTGIYGFKGAHSARHT
jgi:hypothetical protein